MIILKSNQEYKCQNSVVVQLIRGPTHDTSSKRILIPNQAQILQNFVVFFSHSLEYCIPVTRSDFNIIIAYLKQKNIIRQYIIRCSTRCVQVSGDGSQSTVPTSFRTEQCYITIIILDLNTLINRCTRLINDFEHSFGVICLTIII